MKALTKIVVAVSGALAFSATAVSADVVCNDEGDCWRVKTKHEYRPEFKVRIYSDDWKWQPSEGKKYRWRDAQSGRGYYRSGVWIGF